MKKFKLDANRVLAAPSRYDVEPDEWCADYHCAGDCGLLGHGWQHAQAEEGDPEQQEWVISGQSDANDEPR